jgi:hypothetical protein
MTEQKEWFTLPEVAEHYRAPEETVRYWRHCGTGPQGVKVGTRVLFHRSEIERFDRELAQQALVVAIDRGSPPAAPAVAPPKSTRRTPQPRGPSREPADAAAAS